MGFIDDIFNSLRNKTLNSFGVERDITQLIADRDIGQLQNLLQNRDEEVCSAILEYNPETHNVMKRLDKPRKNKPPYIVEKLPRTRQRYINEVELFFLLGKPIQFNCKSKNTDNAFEAFNKFLSEIRYDATMRQAKRLAGSETESAKVYHIYQDAGVPRVKVLVISKSKGYTLRPLFDQYENMVAFGCGYYLKEGTNTVEHFDIQTPEFIFKCKKAKLGWEVEPIPNPTGKINVIYYKQAKAWGGVQRRIDREEHIDSKAADTNNYFADPKIKATADVIKSLADPDTVGEVIQLSGADSAIDYLKPPDYASMKDSEKKDLASSILFDSFTPDFSFESMAGMGTLSGEALKRAMILGYIKRDNLKEVYDEMVDREKNLIISIMQNVTHIGLAGELSNLEIEHSFAEPFDEDTTTRWSKISELYSSGLMSLETAISELGFTDSPADEITRILAKKTTNTDPAPKTI